ncbi:MAG: hypothetical protein ACI9ON_001863 [Limisphaerales bacterium]|jgi:hypothetical protein
MEASYNPDFSPTGIEGGVDTNQLPWIALAIFPGMSIKPLRASTESSMFSLIIKLESGTHLTNLLSLGAMDLMVLSGDVTFSDSPALYPGVWGFIPANSLIDRTATDAGVELLVNCYGPIARSVDGHIDQLLTANHIAQHAREAGIQLVPNSLAECMLERTNTSPAADAPLAISASDTTARASGKNDSTTELHAHFIDTDKVPWIVNPDLPDIALKVLRVSEETGITSLIVRHNGVAGPHYHLGAADFLVISGKIGYRAGPPEGYGAGVWFYEPAGARHEATQRIGEEDLIYTANVYGPIQFDEGAGTPIVAVQSWMQYKELADASGVTLVRSTPEDQNLFAWSPL